MTEFREQDLTGARFERVSLEMIDVQISGELQNVVLNGVDIRRERQAMVRQVMESPTDEQLASDVTRTAPGWPQEENFPVKECLRIVLNEEREHRLYAERDLSSLEKEN
jgi:hypothetical protein